MYYLLTGSDTLPGGTQQLGRPDQVANSEEMPATDTMHNSFVPLYRLRENNFPHVACHVLMSSNTATQKTALSSLNHILMVKELNIRVTILWINTRCWERRQCTNNPSDLWFMIRRLCWSRHKHHWDIPFFSLLSQTEKQATLKGSPIHTQRGSVLYPWSQFTVFSLFKSEPQNK